MKIKYPSLEYRDLSILTNQFFRDPGGYAEKMFVCETGGSDQSLIPVGRFDDGFRVKLYNKGPNDISFEPSGINHLIVSSNSVDFVYSAVDKRWYHFDYYSSSHAPRHLSENPDELDGDRLDIDWDPSVYSPSITPDQVSSIDQLTAHLAGIDSKVGDHSDRHSSGAADELDGDNLDIDWAPSIYSPDDSPAEADGLDSLTAHLKGIDNKVWEVDSPINLNKYDITRDQEVPSGFNGISKGPLNIDSGVTVTVASGSTWEVL